MPEFWILLLALGASLRLTRLVTGDLITEPIRRWIDNRYGEESKAADFVRCPWCIGFWISLGVTALAFCPKVGHHPLFLLAATGLTVSWLVAIAAINLDRH